MDVAAADAGFGEVAVQFLRHAFGEGGYQHALVLGGSLLDFFHEVVYLVFGGPDLDGRVQEAGRAHNLFHHQAFGLGQFVVCRGGAHIHRLAGYGLKFFKGEGAVVAGGREAEAVFHQRLLAGMVPAVHGPDLGERDVAFVDEHQKIVREIID